MEIKNYVEFIDKSKILLKEVLEFIDFEEKTDFCYVIGDPYGEENLASFDIDLGNISIYISEDTVKDLSDPKNIQMFAYYIIHECRHVLQQKYLKEKYGELMYSSCIRSQSILIGDLENNILETDAHEVGVYLSNQFMNYKEGKDYNAKMKPISEVLSDEKILEMIKNYYSALKRMSTVESENE